MWWLRENNYLFSRHNIIYNSKLNKEIDKLALHVRYTIACLSLLLLNILATLKVSFLHSYIRQTGFFSFSKITNQEEEKSLNTNQLNFALKIDLVSHPARNREVL